MIFKILKVIDRSACSLLWIVVLQMVFFSFIQVVLRYFFHTSITWGEELLRYEMVFITFFGASLAIERRAHISITVILDALPKSYAYYIELINIIAALVFSSVLFYYSSLLALKVKATGQLTPALEIPNYIPYLCIPIGTFFMCLRYFIQFCVAIKDKK